MINKLIFNPGTSSEKIVGGENIISVTLTEMLNSSAGIGIGTACSSKLTVDMIVPPDLVFAGASIEAFVIENGVNIPLGFFYVCDASTTNAYKTVTLECYDRFCRMEAVYEPTVEAKAKIADVTKDILSQCSGVLDASTTTPDTYFEANLRESFVGYDDYVIPYFKGYTCRQMLCYIAGLMGKNARFNREGILEFVWYADKKIPGSDDFVTIEQEEQYQGQLQYIRKDEFTISSLTSGSGDDTFSVGNGSGISFENPYITKEQLEKIFTSQVSGFKFQPCSVRYRGNTDIEVGDRICVKDNFNKDMYICVMEQTLIFNGGFQAEIQSYGQSDESYSFEQASTSEAITKLSRRLERAVMMSKNIDNIEGGVFEVIDDNGDGINESFVLRLGDGTGNYIKGNANGIGFSKTGDNPDAYTTVIDQNGIVAESIDTDRLWAGTFGIGDLTQGDIFTAEKNENGKLILILGPSEGGMVLKEERDRIGFYPQKSNTVPVCSLTPSSFLMDKFDTIKMGGLTIYPGKDNGEGNIIFSTAKQPDENTEGGNK